MPLEHRHSNVALTVLPSFGGLVGQSSCVSMASPHQPVPLCSHCGVDELCQTIDVAVPGLESLNKGLGSIVVRQKIVHELDHLTALLLVDGANHFDDLVARVNME
jgi:hypothetical protein